jgi:anti-anti-sigma regulatory factor
MSMAVARQNGETVITVTGSFDGKLALELVDMIKRAADGPASTVVIDLSRVREVKAVALAVLSDLDDAVWTRVRIRGLSLHDQGILRHLTGVRESAAKP